MDDNIPHHPKFLKAGPIASWLWVCGNCYCNRYLTDGFIPAEVLASLSHVPKVSRVAARLVLVNLWEKVPGGYQVHDFHDHNPTAKSVKLKREADRVRKESARNPDGIQADSARIPESPARAIPSHPIPSGSFLVPPVLSPTSEDGSKSNGAGRHVTSLETEEIAERAGRLVEHYGELYQKHRHGARHRSRPNLDWTEACDLVKLWDDHRLDRLAILILTTDDPWISNTDRAFKIFALKASWADNRLTAWEQEHGVKA